VDRAGNRSEVVPVTVTPLESVTSLIAKTIFVKPGFSSFFVDWVNELEQSVNIYVDFNFMQNGVYREYTTVFSSNAAADRRFVNDLELTDQEPVSVKIRVEDIYGNITEPQDMGSLVMLQDELIPKDKWYLPNANDTIAGEPQCWAMFNGARLSAVIDGVTDDLAQAVLYTHTGGKGRTGNPDDGNVPWNIMIDLGDYYELSRVVSHQRRQSGDPLGRGFYYNTGGENVGRHNIYFLDEETGKWEYCSQYTIPIPAISDLEMVILALKGDMAYFYPDEPGFTKPTRWFRYEAIAGFGDNYTSTNALSLCEITLYGRKANR
jgi:hypothetical protein